MSNNKKIEVCFGEAVPTDKSIEMPPKNALRKYLDGIQENCIEIAVHENTREILRKLQEQKGIDGHDK